MKSLTDLAGNLDSSTAQVLTALRIVATRADVEEIVDWTTKELEGYQQEDELPAHRIWKLSIKANLHNPYQAFMREVHLGDFAIDEKFREAMTTCYCRNGVWEIESMLSGNESEQFAVERPNLAVLISKGPMLTKGWICTHATAEFSSMHLKAVMNKARQSALRLCLECEKHGVDLRWGEDNDSTSAERAKWFNMIKEEGTKLILRSAWETVLKSIG